MTNYIIQRQFKLMSGKFDAQYVSSITSKAKINGYDKKRDLALVLTEWQAVRVISELNSIGAKFWSEQV